MRFSRRTLVIVAAFALLFLLGQWLFVPKTYVNSRLVTALQAPRAFFQSLKNRHAVVTELSVLQLENQSLRAQLLEFKNNPAIIEDGSTEYVSAKVYSLYPFNSSGMILVHAGSAHGVTEGAIVLASPGIFLGEVVAVTESTAEVRTIFDPNWELPVKIGDAKIDSLLVGGHEPRLTLISKKKPASQGQTVILAAKDYPYGLTVGAVGGLKDSDRELFQEASVETAYQLNELNQVLITR